MHVLKNTTLSWRLLSDTLELSQSDNPKQRYIVDPEFTNSFIDSIRLWPLSDNRFVNLTHHENKDIDFYVLKSVDVFRYH